MKAVRLVSPGNPLEMFDVPIPQPAYDDVLVKVKAAGICHSDAHYRAGKSKVDPLPLTLGHEVAGSVEELGAGVSKFKKGERVCAHYMATCGHCRFCDKGIEQFCVSGKMIGKYRDGGYAEFVLLPARSLFKLPDNVPFEHGAIMMCSTATSLHALNKARFKAGETVAVFGVGGLGLSAIQLAKAFGASRVFAVDIKAEKLEQARRFGALPIDATNTDPVKELLMATDGAGVNVSLELIGLPVTMKQSVQCLAVQGRAALVGITEKAFEVYPYGEVLNKEAEIIGVSDHLASEIPLLLDLAARGALDLSGIVASAVPLDADRINETLDRLDRFEAAGRTVIKM